MIGEHIQSLIKKKGIKLQDVANDLGITVQHLYKIFKKESIESRYIYKFAEILEVSPHVIIDETIPVDFSETSVGWAIPNFNMEEYNKEIKELKKKISSLESQISDKSEIVEFLRKENMFAFSNVIQLLSTNRQAKDGFIPPDQLNEMTKSKIFDESFLKILLENDLISDADYLFFVESKKKGKK